MPNLVDSAQLVRGALTVGLISAYVVLNMVVFKKSAHYWMASYFVLGLVVYFTIGVFGFYATAVDHAVIGLLLPLAGAVYDSWRRDDAFRTLPAFHWKLLAAFTMGFLIVFPWQ